MTRNGIRAWAGLVCVVCAGSLAAQQGDPSAEVSSGAAASAATRVPRLIKFSGELRDLAGKPLTGVVDAHFAIYRAQQDAAPIWEETQTLQFDEQGRYSVLLGAMQAEGLPVELFTSGEARWLGVTAGKLPEQPRVLMVSVPYALKAADAETLGGKPASAYALAEPSGEKASTTVVVAAVGAGTPPSTSATGSTPETQPHALTTSGATEFNDTTADQVVRVTQKGTGFGLYALAPSNTAVFGRVTNSSGTSYAVRGITPSPSGAGVFGESTSTTGAAYGVRGQSVSDGGGGVLGMNTSPTGVAYGVLGITDSADGAALAARARATTGAALGVQAITYSPNSTAVFAQAAAASGPTTGVLARVNSGSGTALVADNARGGKILSARVGDVEKLSVSGNGNVVASGNVAAASFSGSGAGLTGVAALTAASAASATNAATANSANNLGGVPAASYARRDTTNTFSGDQTVNGNLTVNGTVRGTQFYGDGSGLTVSATALAAVLARLETLENIVTPSRPNGAHVWSKGIGATAWDSGHSIAADPSGNVLVTGYFQGVVDETTPPWEPKDSQVFVAKFSGVDGSQIWSKRFGVGEGKSIAADASGNVLVTGFFLGTVDFGGGPLTSPNGRKIFVAKFSGVDGSHLWSKCFGTINDNEGYGIAVDASGNVLVTGYVGGVVDFGGGPLSGPGGGGFVAKLSGVDGSHIWSKCPDGYGIGEGVAVDASGNVVVAGEFYGVVDFGGGPLTSAGGWDIFLAKFSGVNGSHLWSKRFGGTSYDEGLGIAVDTSGNVVVTGQFMDTVDFGGGPLTALHGTTLFVAKFSGADGSHLWSKGFDGGRQGVGIGEVDPVAVDASGNVLVTGWLDGAADFGGGPLISSSGRDIFVVKLSGPDGSHVWSKRFGGPGGGAGNGVAVDAGGSVLVTGKFDGTVGFGGGPLTSAGPPTWFQDHYEFPTDIFLLKLHP